MKIRNIAGILLLGLLLSSCGKEFLNVEPTQGISVNRIAQDETLPENILEGIHSMFYSYNFGGPQLGGVGAVGIGIQLDMMTDDMIQSTEGDYVGIYNWIDHRIEDGAELNYKVWDLYYTLIQHANYAIQSSQKAYDDKTISETTLQLIQGEAQVIRAYSFAVLVQLFGKRYEKGGDNSSLGVILRLEPNLDPMPRSTVEESYAQINRDLEEGMKKLLAAEEAFLNDKRAAEEKALYIDRKAWITYGTACGIKARVALTQQDYPTAAEFAQKAIDRAPTYRVALAQASYMTPEKFSDYANPDWMWGYQLSKQQDYGYRSFAANFSYNLEIGHQKSLRFAVNRSLYNKMGTKDVRRKWFVCTDLGDTPPGDASSNYFFEEEGNKNWEVSGQCIKFRTESSNSKLMPNVIMRLSEMYYILAEAKQRQGNDGDAQTALNTVMANRDPDYDATQYSSDALLEEIIRNKRLDFYWEGIGFFEMKRLKRIPDRKSAENKDVLSSFALSYFNNINGKAAKAIPTTVDAKEWQFLLPKTEAEGNSLSVQNPR